MLALLTAVALGASTVSVKSAHSQQLGTTVVVNQAGRTLYSLSGESTHHLLCKSTECARFWPPLTVPSRTTRLKAGTGVHGTLGMIRRPNGAMTGHAARQTSVPLLRRPRSGRRQRRGDPVLRRHLARGDRIEHAGGAGSAGADERRKHPAVRILSSADGAPGVGLEPAAPPAAGEGSRAGGL